MCFFKGRNMSRTEETLEKLCNNTVCTINEIFSKRHYIVRISQEKNGNVYLIVNKRRGRLLGEERTALCKAIEKLSNTVFSRHCKDFSRLADYYYVDFKLLKQCSVYHFHF